jgi:acetyl-CoA acetyltransferase
MLGAGYGHTQAEDLLLADGLTDAFDNIAMGLCGEDTAEKMGFTREQCDEFALEVCTGWSPWFDSVTSLIILTILIWA